MTNKYKTVLCPYCTTENLVPGNGQYVCNGCGNIFDVDKCPVPPARQEMETCCPHCGIKNLVCENGRYVCNECQERFDVDCFSIPALKQPDEYSCGWATTLWVLRSFGIDVDPKRLRRELNTDAWPQGTWPDAIYSALRRRGLTVKNPFRWESPWEYEEYLNETFDEGGRAILLFNFIEHWAGAERHNGRIRVMDPYKGTYMSLGKAINEHGGWFEEFLCVGIVRK